MKYHIALLRGINAGGKNLIKMDCLKQVFADMGFSYVKTYIQSGNLVSTLSLREGVDYLHAGINVIYTSRLTSQMNKSYFSKIMQTPISKTFTIRNWNTVTKLYELTNI